MAPTLKPSSTFIAVQTPIAEKDGTVTWTWLKKFQEWELKLQNGLNQIGQIIGNIEPTTLIVGRVAIGTILQFIDNSGEVLAGGIDFARAYLNKDTDHIADGTGLPLNGGKVAQAALVATSPTADDQPVYSGAAWGLTKKTQGKALAANQWFDSYNATTGAFTSSQPAYTSLSGLPILPITILPVAGKYLKSYDQGTGFFTQNTTAGISATIVTAALTAGGTQGSQTFVDGILTAQVQAT